MVNYGLDDIIKRQEFDLVSKENIQGDIEIGGVPKRLSKKVLPASIVAQVVRSIMRHNGRVTRPQIIRETSLCLPDQVDSIFNRLGLSEALYKFPVGRRVHTIGGGMALSDVIKKIRDKAPEVMKNVLRCIAEEYNYDRERINQSSGINPKTFQDYISTYYLEWKRDKQQYIFRQYKEKFIETLRASGYSECKTCKMLGITEPLFKRFVEYYGVKNWKELKREYRKQHRLPVTVIDNAVFIHTPDEKEDSLQKKNYRTPVEIGRDRGFISRQAVWDNIFRSTQYRPRMGKVKITEEAYKQLYKRVR